MLNFIVAENQGGLDECYLKLINFVFVSIIIYFIVTFLSLMRIKLLSLNAWLIVWLYCSCNNRCLLKNNKSNLELLFILFSFPFLFSLFPSPLHLSHLEHLLLILEARFNFKFSFIANSSLQATHSSFYPLSGLLGQSSWRVFFCLIEEQHA